MEEVRMVELKRSHGGILGAVQKSVAPGDRAALLGLLGALGEELDTEATHELLDEALLQYIGDAEIREAVESQERWYA
jgi:hypothetical protein